MLRSSLLVESSCEVWSKTAIPDTKAYILHSLLQVFVNDSVDPSEMRLKKKITNVIAVAASRLESDQEAAAAEAGANGVKASAANLWPALLPTLFQAAQINNVRHKEAVLDLIEK
jgi:hypothetical protein